MRSLRAESKQLAEVTYEEVKKLIITCRLPPGEVVTETALAKALDVSRSPLRSALARLRGERFVTYDSARRSIRVASIDARYIGDIYRVRSPLECLCALDAMVAARDSEVNRLAELADEVKANAKNSWQEFLGFDRKMHSFMLDHCSNKTLRAILEGLEAHWARIDFFLGQVAKESAERWFLDCTRIVDALKNRDEASLIRAVASHIDGAAEVYLSHITGREVSLSAADQPLSPGIVAETLVERARRLQPDMSQ